MKHIILPSLFCLLLCSNLVFAQTRETRTVDKFTIISFRTAGKLYLKQGSAQKLEIEGSKEALDRIETRVDNGKLIIGRPERWFDWDSDDEKITIYVTAPEIEGVSVSGSGDLIGQGKINTDDLDLNVSGSGSLILEADARGDVEADVSGSGSIDLNGKCKSLDSNVSGSGKVILSVNIADGADFSVSGSGKIAGNGSADEVKIRISGSGKVMAAGLEANECDVTISGSGDVEINVKEKLNATISGSGTVSYKGNPAKVKSHASGSGKVRKL